jgi:hypothetical protein
LIIEKINVVLLSQHQKHRTVSIADDVYVLSLLFYFITGNCTLEVQCLYFSLVKKLIIIHLADDNVLQFSPQKICTNMIRF